MIHAERKENINRRTVREGFAVHRIAMIMNRYGFLSNIMRMRDKAIPPSAPPQGGGLPSHAIGIHEIAVRPPQGGKGDTPRNACPEA